MRDDDIIKLNKRRLMITLLRNNETTDSEKLILDKLLLEPDLQATLKQDQETAKQKEKITERIATVE